MTKVKKKNAKHLSVNLTSYFTNNYKSISFVTWDIINYGGSQSCYYFMFSLFVCNNLL